MFVSKKVKFLEKIFPERTFVITTANTTRYLHLSTATQIIISCCLLGLFAYGASAYIKYNSFSNKVIMKENENLKLENAQYHKYFASVEDQLDKIGAYLDVRQSIEADKKIDDDINLDDTKRIIDKKFSAIYSGMEKRNDQLNKKIKKLNMKATELAPKESKPKDNNSEGVGGPFEFDLPIKFGSSKSIGDTKDVKINDTNYAVSIRNLVEKEKLVSSLPLGAPAGGAYRLTSHYGTRYDPFMKSVRAFHRGLDIVIENKKVKTVQNGIVSFVGTKNGYGNVVEIEHGDRKHGIKTRYAHLAKANVRAGQKVSKGDLIGIMGRTGRATNLHLHYELFVHGKQVNPLQFINYREN